MYASNNNSMENDAPQRGTYFSSIGGSNASIVSDKEASGDDMDNQRKESKDKDKIFISYPNILSQEFSSVHSDDYFPNYRSDLPDVSIFCTKGLPPWLLPLKLPDFHENLGDAVCMHGRLHNGYYKNALQHLLNPAIT